MCVQSSNSCSPDTNTIYWIKGYFSFVSLQFNFWSWWFITPCVSSLAAVGNTENQTTKRSFPAFNVLAAATPHSVGASQLLCQRGSSQRCWDLTHLKVRILILEPAKGNAFVIKYRELYQSQKLNNPLVYIGCTSWLFVDRAAPSVGIRWN